MADEQNDRDDRDNDPATPKIQRRRTEYDARIHDIAKSAANSPAVASFKNAGVVKLDWSGIKATQPLYFDRFRTSNTYWTSWGRKQHVLSGYDAMTQINNSLTELVRAQYSGPMTSIAEALKTITVDAHAGLIAKLGINTGTYGQSVLADIAKSLYPAPMVSMINNTSALLGSAVLAQARTGAFDGLRIGDTAGRKIVSEIMAPALDAIAEIEPALFAEPTTETSVSIDLQWDVSDDPEPESPSTGGTKRRIDVQLALVWAVAGALFAYLPTLIALQGGSQGDITTAIYTSLGLALGIVALYYGRRK